MPSKFFLIVYNVSKKGNVGNIVRSACAFGVSEILVVGQKKNLQLFGSQNSDKHVKFSFYDDLTEVTSYLQPFDCDIIGIEIHPTAKNINSNPFTENKNVAFMLGNEGTGLNDHQKLVCDFFVYIPQYGNGTASLNVTVAASIVFHRFSSFSNFDELQRVDEKYVVTRKEIRRSDEAKTAARRVQQASAAARQSEVLNEGLFID